MRYWVVALAIAMWGCAPAIRSVYLADRETVVYPVYFDPVRRVIVPLGLPRGATYYLTLPNGGMEYFQP